MSDSVIELFKPIMGPMCAMAPTPDDGTQRLRTQTGVKLRLPRLVKLKLYNCQRLSGKAVVEAIASRVRYTDGLALLKSGSKEEMATATATLQRVAIVDCMGFGVGDAQMLREVCADRLRVV